jgi:hypothetical protein
LELRGVTRHSATGDQEINHDFGQDGDALTTAALAFLKSTVG